MRRIVLLALLVASCGRSSPDLVAALDSMPGELDAAVGAIAVVLESGLSRADTNERLAALGTTAIAGDIYDRAGRVERPGLEAELARFEAFSGEFLLAAGDIDTAVATGDGDLLVEAWLRIEAGAGSLAVGLPPQWCHRVAPGLAADLCRPEGEIPEYDAAVERAIRLFVARYRPVVGIPDAFDDAERSRAAVDLAPEVLASIEAALADLAALTPPDSLHLALHRAFVDHLVGLRSAWEEVPEELTVDPPGAVTGGVDDVDAVIVFESIWPALAQRLEATVCAATDRFAAARSPLRAAIPASTLPALGELWFYGEATGCP